jgi:hypothetical protein
MSGKIPPHEAWEKVEGMVLDDEVERVAKLGKAEVDEELAAKGVDPKALRARGEALAAKFAAGKAEEKVATVTKLPAKAKAPPRSPGLSLGQRRAVGLAIAAIAAGLVLVFKREPTQVGPVAHTNPPSSLSLPDDASPLELAEATRREAFEACDAKRWSDCLAKLDEAARVDPKGDGDPRVTRARDDANRGIEEALRKRNGGGQ